MSLMWYINYFHVQLLIFELLFCMHLPRRKFFLARLLPCTALYLTLPAIIPGGYFASFVVWGWFTFGFIAMFLLSGLLIGFCFQMNVRQVVFYCCVGHTLQHMVHCLYQIIKIAFPLSDAAIQLLQLVVMLLACIVTHFCLCKRFRGSETVDFQNNYLLMFALASTLIIYVVSYWSSTWETRTIGLYAFDFFSCFLLLVLLLDVFRIRKAERDQVIMQRLLHQEQGQHMVSRATADVINRKCHDLRHQITALRHMDDAEKEQSIRALEKAVLIYDCFPKTGNPDLDVIFAEKCLFAEKQHVSVRCIVDGEKFSFMSLEDLYCLLGNALDNAIEATAGEENEARRIVSIHAMAKDKLYSVHIENPCEKQPVFMDGMPMTSKPDTDNHGYGMRSMRYLCEKYGGALSTGWEDGIFSLNMIFPLEK